MGIKQKIARTKVDVVGIYNSSKMPSEQLRALAEECGFSFISMGVDTMCIVYKSKCFNLIEQKSMNDQTYVILQHIETGKSYFFTTRMFEGS